MSESEAICEIRKRLAKELKGFSSLGTDFSLQRWLEEYDSNVDAIIPKLQWTLNTLSALGANKLDTTSIGTVNRSVRLISPLSEFFPGGLMGYDQDGNITFVQPFGQLQPAKLMNAGKVSDLYRMLILEGYGTLQLLCVEEEKRKKRCMETVIIDMEGFSLHMIYMPAIKVISNVYTVLQLMYPGIAKKIYIVNVHYAVAHAFRLVQAAFTRKTAEGIEFLGNNWRERLINEIGEENILPYWGGKMPAAKATGDIRMGGTPPADLRAAVPQFDAKECAVKIAAGKCFEVMVSVEKGETLLRWYFKADKGDVDFYIVHHGNEVVPRFRLCTELMADFGEIECQTTGLYKICFSNMHSRFWSITLQYKIQLIEQPKRKNNC